MTIPVRVALLSGLAFVLFTPAARSDASGEPSIQVPGPQAAPAPRTSPVSRSQYRLGEVTVSIPTPEGFEEVTARSDEIWRRVGGDSTRLDTLAVHVPARVLATFKPSDDLTFYTKVSVSKAVRDKELSETDYADVVRQVTSGKAFEDAELHAYLSKVAKDKGIAVDKPIELGVVDRSAEAVTSLMMFPVSNGDRSWKLLCETTLLRVRHRLLFVYTYRVFESEQDAKTLEAFTRTWVRQILAANR